MSKIGILGGTFNPIHNGHLLLAEQARCFYGLDQVLFIPSGCSYMKRQEEILPGEIRFQMVQLAIADNPYFCVSDMEIVREGNSYTCETITRLHAQYPEDELYYIVGADTLFQMEFWKNPEQIFTQCITAASVRQGRFCADAAGKIPRVPLPRGYPFHAVPSCGNFFYPGAGSPAKRNIRPLSRPGTRPQLSGKKRVLQGWKGVF